MILDGNNPIVKLENAEHHKWDAGIFDVAPRHYSALAFRLKGSADLHCNGKRFYVNVGDVLYMPQGLGYQVEYSLTDTYVIHFITSENDPLPEVYNLQNSQEVQLLFEQAAAIWKAKKPGYVNFCTGILYRILGMLSTYDVLEKYPIGFQHALHYIHENYRNQFTTEDICKYAGISPTAFRQNFRLYCYTTSTEYIRDLRLEYARRVIASGVSIERAAELCGIGDPKYFARLVNKKYGCSPRELKIYAK